MNFSLFFVSDVEKILKQRPVEMKHQEIKINVYIYPTLNTIKVQGPEEVVNKDTLDDLEMYFEHRRSRGGEIENIEFDTVHNAVMVTFEDEEGKHENEKKWLYPVNVFFHVSFL